MIKVRFSFQNLTSEYYWIKKTVDLRTVTEVIVKNVKYIL